MEDRDPQGFESGKRHPWQTSLDFEEQDASHYLDYVNPGIFDLIDGSPRRVLELGCAAGMFGATLKQRFPGAEVVGIEAGRAAAEMAATRLDRVVHARLEDVDFEAAETGWGEFDTVIAADVLEHLVNPWDLLLRLKRRLAPGAQVVASIPNVRNIWLVSRLLLEGRWEYSERGLLDITHLRFFTLAEIRRLFAETGYVVEAHGVGILPSLQEIYATYQGRGAKVLKLGRLTLEDVVPEELTEFCAEQFFVRCRAA